MTRTVILAALALIGGACTSAPAVPQWQADVLPVLAANCVKCHGYPAQFGAPAGFRLDAYDDASAVDDHGLIVHGASTMYYRIKERVDDGTMPPALPLTGDDQAILDNWAAQATPATVTPITAGGSYASFPVRSGTRPASNHAPTIAATVSGTPSGGFVAHYAIDDADRDLVEGELQIGGVVIASHLRAGRDDVALDLSQVPDGTQSVDAVLDDGFPAMQAGVFSVVVAGNGATPLAITIKHPAAVDFVAQADAAQVDVCANQAGITAAVSAVDPHGVRTPVVLASTYAVPACVSGPSPTTVPWQTFKDGLPDGISDWTIRVVPTIDAAHTVTSPIFRVQHGTPAGTFADVKSTFSDVCGSSCHLTCGAYPATLPYDFNDYTDSASRTGTMPCGPFVGVGSMKGLIYDHVVAREDMPPGDAPAPNLTADQRAQIKAWFEGGANP